MIDPSALILKYPHLENNFNRLDSSIKGSLTFAVLIEQLKWAFNEYEQKRAIHRLHCVILSIVSGDNKYIQQLSAPEKQALIALTVLDGCKNSKPSIQAYEDDKTCKALKDGVPSLFDMLAKKPGVFPIYTMLSDQAKKAIQCNFFYLHLRHLQLGEVPVSSIRKETLQKPRHLMIAFWHANATGFNIEKPEYPLGENTGPTISSEQSEQFDKLLEAIDRNSLSEYYAQDSIFNNKIYLKNSFTSSQVEFICRLGKMLAFIGIKENDPAYAFFVFNHQPELRGVVALEGQIYSKCGIEAFTFMPAVLKALKEKVMPDKSLHDILKTFLALQTQLYHSAPAFIVKLGDNRTIPLFGLSNAQEQMLKKFAEASDEGRTQFHFEASMGQFINVNLVEGPVPQSASTQKLQVK